MKYVLRIAWLGVAVALAQHAAAQDAEMLARLEEALKAASSFEMGGNAGPLQEIEQMVFRLPADSELRGPIEQKLLDTLNAGATTDARRFLCRQLRVIGTEKCVDSLEKLLADPELSHMARYALGRLEAPAASEALLRALGKTSGGLQAGIIDTLGSRKCEAARGELVKLLSGSDETVAKAAAIALGRLGDGPAVAALEAARSGASDTLGIEIDNALLNAAGQLAENGKAAEAAAIYQRFYRRDSSPQLQFAGLRGLAVTRGDLAAGLLTQAMQGDSVSLRRFAISLVGLVPGREATETFVAALGSLSADDKVLMLRALGARGDGAAAKAVAAATRDGDAGVRVAALEALGNVGDASMVLTLAEAAAAAEGMERNVARAALKSLSAAGTDDKLLKLLGEADAAIQVELIHALAVRGVTAAVDVLLPAATSQDPAVRRAAIEALGVLAEESQWPALVKLALAAREQEDQEALVGAAGKALFRVEDKGKCVAQVSAEMARAPAASRPLLVRLLGKTGAPEALGTIRGLVNDGNPALRSAAVRALAEWSDASVSRDLLDLLTDGGHREHKEVILQGYLRLAALSDDPAAMYVQALKHVEEVNDKKAVLEGLGLSSQEPEALDLALTYLDDPALRAAAGVAVTRIAYSLRHRDEQRAASALKQVLAKVDHPDVQRRAQEVLNELDKYEDHILEWMTAGPFQERGKDGAAIYRTVFPPETDPDDAAWKPLTQGIGSWDINLEATYGGLDFVAAYLRTRVWSDAEQSVQLELGSDDGVKVWLNGELLYDQWGEGSASPRQKLVKAKLAKGWNDLMLKVVDQQGGWVGACRIRRPDGTALEGLKVKAE